MGLFGIYAHGILDDDDEGCEGLPDGRIIKDDHITWQMEKKLIGLVAIQVTAKAQRVIQGFLPVVEFPVQNDGAWRTPP